MKNKDQILFIDDVPEEYDKIKALIPSDYTIFQKPRMKKAAVNIFSNFSIDDESTYTFIKKTLSRHYKHIRMIICDLKLGDDTLGGQKVVTEIRKWDAKTDLKMPSEFSWYLKYIPIVCVSQISKNEVDTLSLSLQGCDFVKKPNMDVYNTSNDISQENDECKKIQKLFKSQMERFSFLCESKNLNYQYTIAISYSSRDNDPYFVDAIAQGLCLHYGRNRIFLDHIHKSDLNGSTDKNQKLKTIFSEKAQFVLVILTPNYGSSEGTKTEWQAIQKRSDIDKCLICIKGAPLSDDEVSGLKTRLQNNKLKQLPLVVNEIQEPYSLKDENVINAIKNYKIYCDNIRRKIIDDIIVNKINENK